VPMEQEIVKYINIFCSYLETHCCESSHLYYNVIQFFNTSVN